MLKLYNFIIAYRLKRCPLISNKHHIHFWNVLFLFYFLRFRSLFLAYYWPRGDTGMSHLDTSAAAFSTSLKDAVLQQHVGPSISHGTTNGAPGPGWCAWYLCVSYVCTLNFGP